MMFRMLAVVILVTGGAVAFAESEAVEARNRVMAYDGRTHQYTIHRNGTFDGKCMVKKIVVVCQSYQSGKQAPVDRGATACDLQVGDFYPAGTARLTSWGDRVTVTDRTDYLLSAEAPASTKPLTLCRSRHCLTTAADKPIGG